MRLAFHQFGNDHWGAGNWFVEGLFHGLRQLGTDCPALVLVVDAGTPDHDFASLAGAADEVLRAPAPAPASDIRRQQSLRYHAGWWLRHAVLKRPAPPAQSPLTAVLPRHHIDGYFRLAGSTPLVQSVPSLVWIPDFQHRRLPENFSPEERAARDRYFRVELRSATRVIVTSDAVRRDLADFAPDLASQARLLRYVADVPAEVYQGDPAAGLAAYHLPEQFIYLPNQFWRHKNHRLVLEALALLAARGLYPVIVSTGSSNDYRQPGYFAELMQAVSRLNVRAQFIYLGQVPRADVFRLIRAAQCVLNPSRFEGLGLSVAECLSVGKRVLVSDLPALREQAAPGAVYFDPDQPADLAAKLETAWSTLPPGPDVALETAARDALPRRQADFGRAVLALFREAQAAFHPQA